MNLARQFWTLLQMNLAGIPARLGLVCTIIIGVACAVGVLVSMLAMVVGARQETLGIASPNRIVLTSIDAPSPSQSNISPDDLPSDRATARHSAQRRGQAGRRAPGRGVHPGPQPDRPLADRLSLDRGRPVLTDYQSELRITAGRMFNPGLHELIAKQQLRPAVRGFRRRREAAPARGDWVVVGNFDLASTGLHGLTGMGPRSCRPSAARPTTRRTCCCNRLRPLRR